MYDTTNDNDFIINDNKDKPVFLPALCLGAHFFPIFQLLEEMKSEGLKPDVASFNIAVHACAVGCQWQVCSFLFSSTPPPPRMQLLQYRLRHNRNERTLPAEDLGWGARNLRPDMQAFVFSALLFLLGRCSFLFGSIYLGLVLFL